MTTISARVITSPSNRVELNTRGLVYSKLAYLLDVITSNPQNGAYLMYDSSTSQYIFYKVPTGDFGNLTQAKKLSDFEHTEAYSYDLQSSPRSGKATVDLGNLS